MTVESLKEFMLEQGPSKNTKLQEWDKIWSKNKAIIDPIAPRFTCIKKDTACKLTIENGPAEPEGRSAVLHKKSDLGSKVVMHSREVYLEKTDAELIEEEELDEDSKKQIKENKK